MTTDKPSDIPRILHVTEARHVAGTERSLLMLLDNADSSFRHIVVIRGGGSLADALESRGVDTVTIPRLNRADPLSLVRFGMLLRRVRPHIVHIYGGRLEALLARTAGALVVERKNVCRNVFYRPFLNFRGADRMLNRFIHASIVPSKAVKRHFVERGYPPDRIRVIYNGVEPAPQRTPDQRRLLRAHLGVPPVCRPGGQDAFLVAFAGRLVPEKGVAFLLRALARTPESTWCVIMGNGRLARQLRTQAADLGLHRRVVFTGYRSDVRDVFACADAVVVPSLSDTLPNVALEAMAEGRAVIASEVEGIPEVVEHGVTGLLVPPADASALARAIQSLAANPKQAHALGAEARKRTLTRHAPSRMARETEAVYRDLILHAEEREFACQRPLTSRAFGKRSS